MVVSEAWSTERSIQGEIAMADSSKPASNEGWSLSPDIWAVIVAVVLALAVKLDVFKNIPW
jgi:hypothetical protein